MDKNHRLTKKNIYLLQWPTKLDRYSNKQTISVWQNRSIPFLINLPGAWKLLFCLTRIGLLGRIWSFECCCDDDDDGGGRKGLFTGVELSEKSLSFTCKKNRIVWKNAFWYLSKTASNCEGQVDESLLNVTKLQKLTVIWQIIIAVGKWPNFKEIILIWSHCPWIPPFCPTKKVSSFTSLMTFITLLSIPGNIFEDNFSILSTLEFIETSPEFIDRDLRLDKVVGTFSSTGSESQVRRDA